MKSQTGANPLRRSDVTAKAFTRIAARILGEAVPFPEFKDEQGRGFFAGIRKLFGMKE